MALLTQYWSLDVALILFALFVAAYLFMTRNFKYWSQKGVFEVEPIPFFGNFLDCCIFRKSTPNFLASLYELGKGLPYVGFYIFDRPALVLRDPDIIKNIFIRDFVSFQDRFTSTHEGDTLAATNMLLIKNPGWKSLRTITTPLFTSGKLKKMFQLMAIVGEDLNTHLKSLKLQGEGRAVEVKDISIRYTTDVITSCAFGLQADTLNHPDSEFRKCTNNVFGFTTYRRSAEFTTFFFAPKIAKLLNLEFFSKSGSDFLRKVFMDTMDLRMKNNERRNDLIDFLIQFKKSSEEENDPLAFKLEGDDLVAQAATFFAAGYETSATTMAYSLYELALNPDIQKRVREEMSSAIVKNGGEVTYDIVMNLHYLDMVVSETLRKYPPLPILDREAVADYKVPGHDLVIEKGTPVYIALIGLHYDPEHFPDPEKYDPERFSIENTKNIRSCTYLPFGEGPRNCVGLRFGLLLSKLGIIKFILNYEVTSSPRTLTPLRYDPKALSMLPIGGLFINVREISEPQRTS